MSFRALRGLGYGGFLWRDFALRFCQAKAGAAEAAPAFESIQPDDQFIVGMTNSAPSLMPDGQREVTVLVLV
jgi:hypothetical protein